MTNKELIQKLLDTDLDAIVDFKKIDGTLEVSPLIRGKWLRDGQQAVICSCCNARVSIKASEEMNYCFRCGAKMR